MKLKHYLSVIILMCLAACSTPGKIKATIQSSNYLNPNIYGKASPVVLTVYQLKSSMIFQQSTMLALNNNAVKILSNDLLDKLELEVQPGQKEKIHINLLPETNYLGVVAAFRDADHSQWRQLIPVSASKGANLEINLTTQSVIAELKG